MKVEGLDGELRYGYAVAARLGAWTLSGDRKAGFVISATIAARDEIWFGRRPLRLTLGLGPVEWHWPAVDDVDVERTSTGLTATLRVPGPPVGTAPRGTRLGAPS